MFAAIKTAPKGLAASFVKPPKTSKPPASLPKLARSKREPVAPAPPRPTAGPPGKLAAVKTAPEGPVANSIKPPAALRPVARSKRKPVAAAAAPPRPPAASSARQPAAQPSSNGASPAVPLRPPPAKDTSLKEAAVTPDNVGDDDPSYPASAPFVAAPSSTPAPATSRTARRARPTLVTKAAKTTAPPPAAEADDASLSTPHLASTSAAAAAAVAVSSAPVSPTGRVQTQPSRPRARTLFPTSSPTAVSTPPAAPVQRGKKASPGLSAFGLKPDAALLKAVRNAPLPPVRTALVENAVSTLSMMENEQKGSTPENVEEGSTSPPSASSSVEEASPSPTVSLVDESDVPRTAVRARLGLAFAPSSTASSVEHLDYPPKLAHHIVEFLRGFPLAKTNRSSWVNSEFYNNTVGGEGRMERDFKRHWGLSMRPPDGRSPGSMGVIESLNVLKQDPARAFSDTQLWSWLFPLPTTGADPFAAPLQPHEICAILERDSSVERLEQAHELTMRMLGMRVVDRATGFITPTYDSSTLFPLFSDPSTARRTSTILTRMIQSLTLFSPTSGVSTSFLRHVPSTIGFLLAAHNEGLVALDRGTDAGRGVESEWGICLANRLQRDDLLRLTHARRGAPDGDPSNAAEAPAWDLAAYQAWIVRQSLAYGSLAHRYPEIVGPNFNPKERASDQVVQELVQVFKGMADEKEYADLVSRGLVSRKLQEERAAELQAEAGAAAKQAEQARTAAAFAATDAVA